jgi:divalent metal cation (Fe/Co/Zn/Cd) transporter
MEKMARIIASTNGVKTFHKLRARHAGSKMLVEMHIWVDPELMLKDAHKIAHDVKKRLMRSISEIKDATIHVEPYNPKLAKK